MKNTSPLLYIILNLARSNQVAITIVESSTVDTITEAIALKVNSQIPHRLASFFYINKKNKISYYRKDAWGSLETWNAGANNWEYSPGMNAATLIKLPACAFKTPVEAVVEVTKVTVNPVLPSFTNSVIGTQPIKINDLTNRHPILDEAKRSQISERAKELAQKNVDRRVNDNLINVHSLFKSNPLKFSLTDLITKHNVHKYPTVFVKGENNYAFVYVFEKQSWEVQLRVNYMIGTITVTSIVCAHSVVKELNDLGVKPDQI